MKLTTYKNKKENTFRSRLVHSNENPFVGREPSRAFLVALDAVSAIEEKDPKV